MTGKLANSVAKREVSPSGDRILPAGTRVHQILYGGLGGHASVATSLVLATGHLKHSLSSFSLEPPSGELLDFCREHGVDLASIVKTPGLDLLAWSKIFADLRMRAPDVVIVHSSTTLPAVLLHRLMTRTVTICVDHTSASVKTRREWLSLLMAMKMSDRQVFLTPSSEEDARARFGRFLSGSDKNRMTVIPNGIDVERFAPTRRPEAAPSRIRIAMLSRFTPHRDHFTLLEGVKLLLKKVPALEQGLELVLAGDGETLQDVRAEVARRELTHIVSLPGTLAEPEVIELLRKTTIYVHSSLAETMSTSVMQALSVGCPVIATRIPGMDFLIDHGRNGILVPPRDAESLSESLDDLIFDIARRDALGKEARIEAVERLSCKQMAILYEGLIAELL